LTATAARKILTGPKEDWHMGQKGAWLALCVLLVAGLAVIAPAVAAPPERVVIEDIHIEQVDSTSCSFPFLEVFDGRVTITTFFDDQGNPIRIQFHLPFHGTLTNEATGESVSADQVLQLTVDLEEGTESDVGLRFRVVFPGLGIVLLDAGKVVFDADGNVAFAAGPHQIVNEDFAEFCAAFVA
jgi:hypothetical protein